MKYKTDIILGDRYRDEQTGSEGTAVALVFFQHGCERVELELGVLMHEIKTVSFDAPRLTHIETGKKAESERPGGPDKTNPSLLTRQTPDHPMDPRR